MPVRSRGNGCYQWGHHGKVYCGPGARAKAERQGRAAYSHGYQDHEVHEDDEWDRARADRSVAEIERLELERLEHAKAAMREAKAFIRDFVASDKRLLRQIRRHVGYLDANGIWPTNDPDEIAVEDLIAPWEDAVNAAEPVNDPKELLQLIEEAEREYEEERREQAQDEYDEDDSPLEDDE